MSGSQKETFRIFLAKQVIKLGSLAGAWRLALSPIENITRKLILENADPFKTGSFRQREDKIYMLFNIVRAAFKAYEKASTGLQTQKPQQFS